WDRQQTDTLVLADADAIVGFTADCIATPVTSFLVKRPEDWLGVGTRVSELGTWRGPIYRRPERFFRRDGVVSEWVQLAWELPPLVERAYGLKGFQREVKARVAALVEGAHREARERGIGFMGMDKVLSQSVWDRPKTSSPREAGLEAKPRRRVAASDAGLMRALLERLHAFRERHRAALERFREGLSALFPAGTWLAWRHYGARRVEAPASWWGSSLSTA
ncbi:MAG: hypothetical protein IT199_07635, partial [Solirubrobacterales bacterium]|nr:hypothetical protein [Solirubrobacterales bacterium]